VPAGRLRPFQQLIWSEDCGFRASVQIAERPVTQIPEVYFIALLVCSDRRNGHFSLSRLIAGKMFGEYLGMTAKALPVESGRRSSPAKILAYGAFRSQLTAQTVR